MIGRLKIIAAMLIWGSVGIFGRFTTLSGFQIAFYRVFLGALLLFPLVFKRTTKTPTLKAHWKSLLGLGASLALNWVFLFTAFNYTTISKAVLTYYLAPIIATLISWRFLDERITSKRATLVGVAFLGLVVIISGEKLNLGNRDFLGILFALFGAIFYAMIPNFGRFLREIDGDVLTFLQLAIASVFLLPTVTTYGGGSPVWWAVMTLVVLHTILALFLYMDGLKEVEVNEVAILSYFDPLSAVVYAFFVFGEVPSIRTAFGGMLILLASALDALDRARGP